MRGFSEDATAAKDRKSQKMTFTRSEEFLVIVGYAVHLGLDSAAHARPVAVVYLVKLARASAVAAAATILLEQSYASCFVVDWAVQSTGIYVSVDQIGEFRLEWLRKIQKIRYCKWSFKKKKKLSLKYFCQISQKNIIFVEYESIEKIYFLFLRNYGTNIRR